MLKLNNSLSFSNKDLAAGTAQIAVQHVWCYTLKHLQALWGCLSLHAARLQAVRAAHGSCLAGATLAVVASRVVCYLQCMLPAWLISHSRLYLQTFWYRKKVK
jgi:hypothetical protein